MSDTIKIPRPKFPREGKATGRVEHDSRGNAIFKRTRSTDTEVDAPPSLQLVDDAKKPRKPKG